MIILLVLGYLLYRGLKSWVIGNIGLKDGRQRNGAGDVVDEMVKDPYCKVYFPKRNAIRLSHGGRELYFCSNECRDKFLQQRDDGPQ